MTDLINLLEDMQTQTPSPAEDGALTSAQISGTLYLTRLALARIYVVYWDQSSLDMARSLFLRAIHSKWKIDEQKLNTVAAVRNHPASGTFLGSCNTHTLSFRIAHVLQ